MHLISRKSPAPHPLVPPSLPYCGHGALAHWFSVMRATEEPSHIRTCGMRIFMLHSCLCSQDTEHKRREVVTPGRSRCNLSRGGFSLLPGSLTVRSCRQHAADGAQPELGKQPTPCSATVLSVLGSPAPRRAYTNSPCSCIRGTVHKHQALPGLTWTQQSEATSWSGEKAVTILVQDPECPSRHPLSPPP